MIKMQFRLSLTQTQKLALTPQLQQSLKILQLSTADLLQEVATALQENPFLETDDSSPSEDISREKSHWEASSAEETDPWDWIETPKSLSAHLLEQLGCLGLPIKENMRVQWLIGALGDNGFLPESLEDIAKQYPIDDSTSPEQWQTALATLQSFDPIGVGARGYQECLLLQLNSMSGGTEDEVVELARAVIKDFYVDLAHKRFSQIEKALDCSKELLREAVELICSLNPHPASDFSSVEFNYVIPEIEVFKSHNRWQVRLLSGTYPRIKINELYAGALNKSFSERDSQIWHGRLNEAKLLIKNIKQRQETLLRVSSLIVEKQKDFFNFGAEKMRPMVLRELADELQMHESTISRVTSGKYLSSPQGVFELKYFFSSSVSATDSQEDISATAVKAELKKILSQENSQKPFSDAKLADLLEKQGIKIARRTVAKYREAMGYPAASLRKKF